MHSAAAHRRQRAAAAALAVFALADCTFAPEINFVDHTGQPFRATIRDATARVPAFGHDSVHVPGLALRALIRQGRCRFAYDVPTRDQLVDMTAPDRLAPAAVQLEPDMRLYLMPPGATAPVDVATLAPLQRSGFPLSPTSTECDEPAPGAG
jgi:hypothetical protein